ncbi:MAG TPA: hypothetical protein V6C46_03935 [Coleofasciculaceae cyanobacterium]
MDELRIALELATDEELQDLTEILFRPKFNPLDYVNAPDPIEIQNQGRDAWIEAIERRFRFLAADGMTVLSRKTEDLSYRQVLIRVLRYLKLPYQTALSTIELESEIFLHLLRRACDQLPEAERSALTVRLQRSLTKSQLLPHLPLTVQKDPLQLFLKGGGVLTVNSVVQPLLLRHIAGQFALHFAAYQTARGAIATAGGAATNQFSQYVLMQTARRGMAMASARYAVVRGVFAVLGPSLWVWFFADLGWRSISTNYGRIIPIIFALAQIRLTRQDCAAMA